MISRTNVSPYILYIVINGKCINDQPFEKVVRCYRLISIKLIIFNRVQTYKRLCICRNDFIGFVSFLVFRSNSITIKHAFFDDFTIDCGYSDQITGKKQQRNKQYSNIFFEMKNCLMVEIVDDKTEITLSL